MGYIATHARKYEIYSRARGNMENIAEAGKRRMPPGRGDIFHISERRGYIFHISKHG